jgi:hypothetical protein
MYWDMRIYPNTRISKLPTAFQTIGLILRNLVASKSKKRESKVYQFDGVVTLHNMSVIESPRMQHSINSANEAAGWDYQIPMRVHQAIWCVDTILKNKVTSNSSLVEIGTGRGYVMMAVLQSRSFLDSDIHNQVFLCDSYLPYSLNSDNKQVIENGVNKHYAANVEQTRNSFSSFKNVQIVEGNLPESLDLVDFGSIGFCHIDLNNPRVELYCLEKLWPKIELGGIILIDDYAHLGYDTTYKTFNEFAIKKGITILTTAFGQGIIVKSS